VFKLTVKIQSFVLTLFVTDNTQGLTLGVGLLVDVTATKFKFDYAFNQMNDLGNTNNFTISLIF